MERGKAAPVLHDRLGDSGVLALHDLLEANGRIWKEDVLTVATERFERRLGEECGALRLDMTRGFAGVRREMTDGFAALRQEMAQMRVDLTTAFHRELANVRVDLIKWSFVFWIGQLVALSGVMALMLRASGR